MIRRDPVHFKSEFELGAFTPLALHRDLAIKCLHNVLADGQAQAYSLLVVFATCIEFSKCFEYLDLINFSDADASIFDRKLKIIDCEPHEVHVNRNRSLTRKFEGILGQVDNNLHYPSLVRLHCLRHVLVYYYFEVYLLQTHLELKHVIHGFHYLCNINFF